MPPCLQVGSVAEYLAHGPGFVFLAHPALGPLWQVAGQKIRGGSLAPRAEVQLEVAEACLRDVHVQARRRGWLGAAVHGSLHCNVSLPPPAHMPHDLGLHKIRTPTATLSLVLWAAGAVSFPASFSRPRSRSRP